MLPAQIHSSSLPVAAWEGELDVVKSMIGAADLDDTEFRVFTAVAKQVGLNPLAKQIYAIPYQQKLPGTNQYRTKLTIVCGIDGYRAIAERSGCYAGSDEPEYGPAVKVLAEKTAWENGKKVSQTVELTAPEWAKVTTYKIVGGVRCPFTAKVFWNEYFPASKPGKWLDMPFHMLAKCAEANALRKAFPNDLSGLYVADETDRFVSEQPTEPAIRLGEDGSIASVAPASGGGAQNAAADALAKAAQQAKPEVIEAQFTEDPPSGDQRSLFFAVHTEIGMPAHDGIDKQVNYRVWGKIVGREVTSWTQLSKAEVSQIVDWMNAVKEGRAKIPPIHKYRDELTGQATLQPQEPRGMIDGFSDLVKRLKLTEGQVDKLLKLKGDRNADTIACCGWIRGYETFEQFETLFADAFDDLEEMNGGAA